MQNKLLIQHLYRQYGESAKNDYLYETAVFTDTELTVHYTIVYRKFVWGIPTSEAIQISVNLKGDIVGVNAKSLGLFSGSETELKKEELENAISAILM